MRLVRATFLCLAAAGAAPAVHAQALAADGAVLHVVLFDLQEGASAEDARALANDSRRLLADIPGVESVSVGPKALDDRDAHVKDYDVALCVRLRSLADLKAYGPHPQHRELVEKWKARATWRVIDFFDR